MILPFLPSNIYLAKREYLCNGVGPAKKATSVTSAKPNVGI